MTNTLLINNRQNRIVLTIAVAVVMVLVFYSYKRFEDYREYQYQLAQLAAGNIAEKISNFVRERQRLVSLFANQNIDLIENLLKNPESEHAQRQMQRNLRLFFPNYFTYTLASPDGTPYFEDFTGLVMESCRNDLASFAKEGLYMPHIHPHPENYHFDIMARYDADNNSGILFISFKAEFLGEILQSVQPGGQRLILVYPEKNDLIEVVTEGTRANLQRDDYHLSDAEKARVLVRSRINNTRWQAVILANPNLFSDYQTAVFIETLTIIVVLLIFAGWIIYKNNIRLRLKMKKQQDAVGSGV